MYYNMLLPVYVKLTFIRPRLVPKNHQPRQRELPCDASIIFIAARVKHPRPELLVIPAIAAGRWLAIAVATSFATAI